MKDKNPQSFPGRTQTQINRAVKNAWKNWSTKINTGRGFPNHLFRGQQVYRATELIKKIQRLSSSNLLTPSNDPSSNLLTPSNDPDEDEQLDDPVLDVGEVAQNRSMSIAEARESGRSRREASLVETRRRNETMTVFNEHLTGTRLVY